LTFLSPPALRPLKSWKTTTKPIRCTFFRPTSPPLFLPFPCSPTFLTVFFNFSVYCTPSAVPSRIRYSIVPLVFELSLLRSLKFRLDAFRDGVGYKTVSAPPKLTGILLPCVYPVPFWVCHDRSICIPPLRLLQPPPRAFRLTILFFIEGLSSRHSEP